MPHSLIERLARAAGVVELDDRQREEIQRLISRAGEDPLTLVPELLTARRQLDTARAHGRQAAETATELAQAMQKLAEGSNTLVHIVTVRSAAGGPMAVCRANGYLRELPIHPDVDLAQLQELKSWEYACVHEDAVVGLWKDDTDQFANAMGDIVTFRAYKDRQCHLVRVTQGPEEKIVELDPILWEESLSPDSLLILQRDNPQRAISVIQREVAQSRFEVPIEGLQTRLEDLAGVAELADKLIQDILLRVCRDDIRSTFALESLKGILLYSRPGMGKTALVRALALWFHEHREELGVDIVLYNIKPNETKSMWHGEDSRIVREDLWGPIRARLSQPRTRPLIILVVFDELDSMGQRAGAGQHVHSAAQSDGLEAMLAEMDGIVPNQTSDGPPVQVLTIGLTNRLDRVDEALQRPGRFDLVLPMPDVTVDSAEDVMAIYARQDQLPWQLDGEVQVGIAEETVRSQFLRPALAWIFPMVVLRYKTDAQHSVDITAGQFLANVHYKEAVNRAKRRAAVRCLRQHGVPALAIDDVMDCLLEVATDAARQMEEDPQTLIRQLSITTPVTTVRTVPREELEEHRYLRMHSA